MFSVTFLGWVVSLFFSVLLNGNHQVNGQFMKKIEVVNNSGHKLNIHIAGAGAGGCDIGVSAGKRNPNDCECVWGTVNYVFCAYMSENALQRYDMIELDANAPGDCPSREGSTLVCSDLSGLDNCYDPGYVCTVHESGTCECNKK